ncbi:MULTISPECIES: hypothetical protein [unclassified Pseudomonas]|uniref:hypothetical protein n=1 Tax=unclassified Pseudomonas TaxID=196821 RepID=UPI001F570CB8|nr:MULTISPECIES: hypothetical protein [unclassified Pseudomonas]
MIDNSARNLAVFLIRATANRSVTWTLENAPMHSIPSSPNQVLIFLTTRYQDQRIAIFESVSGYNHESDSRYRGIVTIAIMDESDRMLWRYDGVEPEFYELLSDARRSLTVVDDFLRQFR